MNFIIAGASKGSGREMAKIFVNEGHKVVALARSSDLLESLRTEVKTEYADNLFTFSVDLIDELGMVEVFKHMKEKILGQTTLILCAATWTGGVSVKEWTASKFREAMDLNFYTGFNPISSFIKNFDYSPELPNTIIVMGATASLRGGKNCSGFAVPKASLRILCQSLAREEGERGLHVAHIILDGLINNQRTRELNPEREKDKYMNMKSISKEILNLSQQSVDAWTHELDLRPYNERF